MHFNFISVPDFETIFNEHCKSDWAEVASDGSYLCIDTNPDDEDGMFEIEAYAAIADINEILGLSKAVYKRMGETSSSDGRQEVSNDEVIVTWKYHPDYGMEVTYEKK